MKIFPEHISRRYIPPPEYENLILEQRCCSFIGMPLRQIAPETIEQRIDSLSRLEVEFGFYYVAEKLWLQEYLSTNRSKSIFRYDQWLLLRLFQALGSEPEHVKYWVEGDDFPDRVWRIGINSRSMNLGFEQLKHCKFQYPDTFELLVLGNESGIYPAHLVTAYEYLHDFQYILEMLSQRRIFEDLSRVEGIEVVSAENPFYWLLNLRDSGGGWDTGIVHRS